MPATIGYAALQIIPSIKGLKGELDSELTGPLEAAAKQAGDKAGASLKMSASQAGDQFTKMGIGGLAVGAAIGAGLLKAGEAASNLGESVNAVKVTFGDAAGGILKLGENAATSMGLSNTAFNGLAVQFSAFATTIAGSGGDVVGTMKELTQRAADFGSVMNVDIPDAARIFQSALAGETEPIRKFGIDLSAAAVGVEAVRIGLVGSAKEMTESDKVQARYSLLMKATAKDAGDFANTSDGAANSTRIAKAELENAAASMGSIVTPIMAAGAGIVAKVAGAFTSLNEASGGWVAKGAGIVGAAAAIAGGLSFVIGQGLKMQDRFSKMGDAASVLKSKLVSTEGGFTKLGKAGVVLGVAMGVATLAFMAYEAHAKDVAQNNQLVADSISKLGTVADVEFGKQWTGTIMAAVFTSQTGGKAMVQVFDEIAQASMDGAERALAYEKANRNNTEIVNGLTAAINKQKDAVAQQAERAAAATAVTDAAAAATGAATPVIEDNSAALAEQAVNAGLTAAAVQRVAEWEQNDKDATKRLNDTLDDQSNQFSVVADAANVFKKALDQVFGASMSAEEADRGLRESVEKTKAAFVENGTTLDINTTKGRANRSAVEDQAKAIIAYGVAQVGSGVSAKAAADLINWNTEALKQQLTAAGLTTAEVDAYITKLGLTPANVNTAITIAETETEKAKLKGWMDQLGVIDAGAAAEITAATNSGDFAEAERQLQAIARARNVTLNLVPGSGLKLWMQPGQVGFEKLATGTDFWKGGPVFVADQGPELINLPRGTQVHTAAATRRLMDGASLGGSTAGTRQLFGDVTVNNQTDWAGFLQVANLKLAGVS